ncbi:hypothetical protein ACJMK2_023774 [Sinanodonta woodiana]|uniref:Uncharacterized protein n=1 Tax=Sinanodonta woodiana TaxID=1069815 RepID=A0ABD3T5B7_SINWO
MDGTTDHNDTFWINQKDFNYVMFEFNSLYEPPRLSYRPIYIHDAGFGIVGGQIFVNVSKIPRSGRTIRDVAFTKQYNCSGLSDTDPNKDIANASYTKNSLYKLGRWFAVEFTARSGGFRHVLQPNFGWFTQIYRGQTYQKVVEFKFDFEVPKHCSEENITETCTPGDFPLRIENEFTKLPIHITWGGWTDTTSGMKSYHLEIFKLSVNLYGNLTEISPLNPIHSADINHTQASNYSYVHTPSESGMYSVLLQAIDKANNSKIARRLVLYDPNSTISVNVENDDTFYVSSAARETGYMWQSAKQGTKTECTVQWTNHFSNNFISDGKLLNKVNAYPSQFENIEREGILKTKKFVYPGFDDNEGERTVEEKPNKNGIVHFEVNILYPNDINEPANGWRVNGLSDRYTFSVVPKDGKPAFIWVRAHDVLGNVKDDNTIVYFDSTPPVLSNNSTFARNQKGTYNHTSRLTFDAWDADSGVYKIEFRLIRNDNYQIIYNNSASVSVQNISCNSRECYCVLEKCFIFAQILDLDNCWFMMAKEDLDKVNVTVEVTVYNQALLETKLSVNVDTIYGLHGLEKCK